MKETHKIKHIGWLRAAVLGANDGIVSTASLVIGVAAANASHGSILVAAIVRQNEIIIPYGNDVIKERDNVILIAYDTILSDLNEMVSSEE